MSEHVMTTVFQSVGADQVIATNQNLIQQLQQLSNSGTQYGAAIDDLNGQMKNNMAATYGLRRGYAGMRLDTRMSHMALIDFGATLQNVGSIGNRLNSMFNTYNTAQIRITDAQGNLTKADENVTYAQQVYNKDLQEFGAQSSTALAAQIKLTDAVNAQKTATANLSAAQNMMNYEYISWLLMVPQIGTSLIKLGLNAKNLQDAIITGGGLMPTIANSGFGGALGASAIGTGSTAGTVAAMGLGTIASTIFPPLAATLMYNQQQGLPLDTGIINLGGVSQWTKPVSQGGNQPEQWWGYIPIIGQIIEKLGYNPKASTNGENRAANPNASVNVTINQTNQIQNTSDAQAAADKAYQAFLDNLKQQGLAK